MFCSWCDLGWLMIPGEITIVLNCFHLYTDWTCSSKRNNGCHKNNNSGKALGPGGLPALYYKYFDDNLTLSLQTIMDSVLPKVMVPESWKAANIALIHKEDQNPTLPKIYHPISILNNGYKKITAILAESMKAAMKYLIYEKQCGLFYSKDN